MFLFSCSTIPGMISSRNGNCFVCLNIRMLIHFFIFDYTVAQITKMSVEEKARIALISALLMQVLASMNIAYSKQRDAFIVFINQTVTNSNTYYY